VGEDDVSFWLLRRGIRTFGFCAAVFVLCADAANAAANNVTRAIPFIINLSVSG
jgi:hypothetical protein